MINYENLDQLLKTFKTAKPFNYCIIDDFFEADVAQRLAAEFPSYDSPDWYVYKNAIENKKALNNWEKFPRTTYLAFSELQSSAVTDRLSAVLGEQIYVDHGLNGGGWHIHGVGGNLNPHLDYSIHPKLGLERVVNIIIYISPELKPEHGGDLGLWYHDVDEGGPKDLAAEVSPRFNRAVIFNTTQNSWHGMSRALEVPEGVYRKSLAVYYLREPAANASARGRALFAPRIEQRADENVLETIRLRSDISTSSEVYRVPE